MATSLVAPRGATGGRSCEKRRATPHFIRHLAALQIPAHGGGAAFETSQCLRERAPEDLPSASRARGDERLGHRGPALFERHAFLLGCLRRSRFGPASVLGCHLL